MRLSSSGYRHTSRTWRVHSGRSSKHRQVWCPHTTRRSEPSGSRSCGARECRTPPVTRVIAGWSGSFRYGRPAIVGGIPRFPVLVATRTCWVNGQHPDVSWIPSICPLNTYFRSIPEQAAWPRGLHRSDTASMPAPRVCVERRLACHDPGAMVQDMRPAHSRRPMPPSDAGDGARANAMPMPHPLPAGFHHRTHPLVQMTCKLYKGAVSCNFFGNFCPAAT